MKTNNNKESEQIFKIIAVTFIGVSFLYLLNKLKEKNETINRLEEEKIQQKNLQEKNEINNNFLETIFGWEDK